MLVVDLGKWMNKILIDWGIDPKVADRFDETIIALLMIAIAIGLNYLCQAILIGGMKRYTLYLRLYCMGRQLCRQRRSSSGL